MQDKMGTRPNLPTRTILLKSPDSNKVREVIITEIVVPDGSNKRIPFVDKMDPYISKANRKRRLDHLTVEEKILRKKLKNREAAQTSRDRKKARMDELEAAVKRLSQEAVRRCPEFAGRERQSVKRKHSSSRGVVEVACRWGCDYRTCRVPKPSAEGSPTPVGTPPTAPCDDQPTSRLKPQLDERSDIPDKSSDDAAVVPNSPLPDLFDLDWLADCCDANMEDLEDFADSLYKEALSLERSESQDEAVVGPVPESVESDGKNGVCDAASRLPERPPTDSVQRLIKKEKTEEQVELSTPASPSEYFESSSEFIVLYPHCITTANSLINSLSNPVSTQSYVVIEDAVEEVCCTSESEDVVMTSPPSDDSGLSESEGSDCASSLHSPSSSKNEDESVSDHGYDSVDSPQSEPDQLRQLFPELW